MPGASPIVASLSLSVTAEYMKNGRIGKSAEADADLFFFLM